VRKEKLNLFNHRVVDYLCAEDSVCGVSPDPSAPPEKRKTVNYRCGEQQCLPDALALSGDDGPLREPSADFRCWDSCRELRNFTRCEAHIAAVPLVDILGRGLNDSQLLASFNDSWAYTATSATCEGVATAGSRAECEASVGTCDQGGHTTKTTCEASNSGAGVFSSTSSYVDGSHQSYLRRHAHNFSSAEEVPRATSPSSKASTGAPPAAYASPG
jgi:hypothetical protein